jgi:O-antigen/teichoic acid export membrane protein
LHKSSDVNTLVYLTAIYTIIQSFVNFFLYVFQSYEKMQHNFIVRSLYGFSLFLICIIIILQKLSVQAIAVGYIIASLISLFAVLILTIRYFTKFFIEFDYIFWKKIIKESWYFFAGVICMAIYVNVDTTLISIFRNYTEVGLYQSADKVLAVFLSLTLVHQVIFPKLSSLYSQNNLYTYKKLMKNIIVLSFVIIIPIGLIVSIFSKEIMVIIYGKEYESASIALIPLIWTGILIFFSTFWGNTLVISKRQDKWFYSLLLGAIVNVILNLIFIPYYGYFASAIITFVSEVVIIIYSYLNCPKNLRNFLNNKNII